MLACKEPLLSYLLFLLAFWTVVQAQGLVHTRKLLYQLNYIPSPFLDTPKIQRLVILLDVVLLILSGFKLNLGSSNK